MVHIGSTPVDDPVEIAVACDEFAFVAAYQFGIDFAHPEALAQLAPQAAGLEILFCRGQVEY